MIQIVIFYLLFTMINACDYGMYLDTTKEPPICRTYASEDSICPLINHMNTCKEGLECVRDHFSSSTKQGHCRKLGTCVIQDLCPSGLYCTRFHIETNVGECTHCKSNGKPCHVDENDPLYLSLFQHSCCSEYCNVETNLCDDNKKQSMF